MPNLIVAPLPWADTPWLWCTCLGMRAMLLVIQGTPTPHWLCLRCGETAEYGEVYR